MSRPGEISIDLLRRLISCDPETGSLTWLARTPDMFADGKHTAEHSCAKWNSKNAGKAALNSVVAGRHIGRIFRRQYNAPRVVWALCHGKWPVGVIDHRDHNTLNDSLSNLRDCAHQQNIQNSSSAKSSSSKFLGVHWDTNRRKWGAKITPNGRTIHLGRHKVEEDAARAYDRAAIQHFGDFANLNFPQTERFF